ncbi:hypothetical protein RD110_16885 [Rhodoferax koreense]|uniref:Uncharacterized protein n=2 Tax=Rhodoferax koreensis TaxID=1842727 RepID=A0A1P8JY30_9BURK|nr:hypothetical protein RD110_16885 [Rhodoferax koreense]
MRWPASIGLACAIAVALTAPGATRADEVRWAATATAPVPSPTFARPVANSQLADLRGGTQNTHNDMTLSGTTADNSAYQVTTGSNAISTGSFANMSGIPVVIQNTGANVLIQNAVILNLQMN